MEERRIAQLEAENALLHQRMSAKDSHIAMLEDRLLKMSVELASSRAREDEQHLFYRLQHRNHQQLQKQMIISMLYSPLLLPLKETVDAVVPLELYHYQQHHPTLDRSERSLDRVI